MGLSLHERRVIADIERSLSQEDPGLARALAEFGRTRPGGRPVEAVPARPARPAAGRPAPPVQAPPADETGDRRRARRVTAWSVVVALTLLSAALALSEAGLLVAAAAAALGGFVCWAVSRRERRRGPPGPERGG